MKRITVALAASLLTAGSALASDKEDILVVLKQWIASAQETVATCADDAAVIDDLPPFEWHGPGACSRWQKDSEANDQKEGITDASGTIGKPRQFMISGDRAYVSLPTTFAYTQKGKRVTDTATTSIVLHKTPAGWRIIAWAWGAQSIH